MPIYAKRSVQDGQFIYPKCKILCDSSTMESKAAEFAESIKDYGIPTANIQSHIFHIAITQRRPLGTHANENRRNRLKKSDSVERSSILSTGMPEQTGNRGVKMIERCHSRQQCFYTSTISCRNSDTSPVESRATFALAAPFLRAWSLLYLERR